MPPSDDDTDPISSQTTAPPDDESSEKRSSAAAPTNPGRQARTNTVRGLGEAPASLNYKRPGDYSAEEFAEIMDAFVRAPRQFPPVKTAFSNGLRAAAYSGQPHAVHGGVDTLPPDEGVIVSIPEEITQPPARRPQDNTTVDLPPIPTGLARREARIALALVAALALVIGVGFVMKTEFQAANVAPVKSSTAVATAAPVETSGAPSNAASMTASETSPAVPHTASALGVSAGSAPATIPAADTTSEPSIASTPTPSTAIVLPRNPTRPVKPAIPPRHTSMLPEDLNTP